LCHDFCRRALSRFAALGWGEDFSGKQLLGSLSGVEI
jgi:hypothetical protein